MIRLNLQKPGYGRTWRNRKRTIRALDLAGAKRYRLIVVLGNACAVCGSTYFPGLQIDHVLGKTWKSSHLSKIRRVNRYWAEYRKDVPLQVLCGTCNQKKGKGKLSP